MLFDMLFSHPLIKCSYHLTNKSDKMVDDKSKTSLSRHAQKNTYTEKYISLIKINNIIVIWEVFLVGLLHCTPVGSKPGSDMPNMAVPDLNKI